MNDSQLTRTGSLWAWVPVLLLGSMFVGLGSMAYVAVDDPGFALEPSYYDKAVHWDRSQAEAKASRELGLRLSLSKPLVVSPRGRIALALAIVDREGAALVGADVRIDAFANARASQIEQLRLRETSPGAYQAEISRGRAGIWELRVVVQRGTLRYREVLRVEVGKGDAA